MPNDAIDDLFDKADEEGNEDRWDFEENPIMKGILVGVGVAPSAGYGPFYILRIKEEKSGDTFGVAVFGTVMNNQVRDSAPEIGKPIGIKYEGLKPNKAGDREYKSWKIVSPNPNFVQWAEHEQKLNAKGSMTTLQERGQKANEDPGDFF